MSDSPDVHRALVVKDPAMSGRDVANFQRAVKDRLEARNLGEIKTPTHGKFTHATWVAGVEAGYFLGLLSQTYLKTTGGHGVATKGAQEIIRHPATRDADQRARATARHGQQNRGPRYYAELIKAPPPPPSGVAAALAFARDHIGVTESPAGSNWGGKVEVWIKAAGYSGPVPWCGCFVNACIMAGGLESGAGWIGYTPAIVARAKAGTGRWSWHSAGVPGDLALFDTPGGDPAVHVGMVEKMQSTGAYQTIEGNTSSGPGGSQSNGGGVFRRQRSTEGNFHIIGFARPPWA